MLPGWLRAAWHRLWHDETVDLSSPLPLEEAVERLAAGITPRARRLVWTADVDQRVVVGSADAKSVRLLARRIGNIRGWDGSVLRARLVPDGVRCRLVGRLGVAPFRRRLIALQLLFLLVFTVVSITGLALSLRGGHGARGLVIPALLPWPAALFVVWFDGSHSEEGREDDEFLLARVRDALQAG